MNTKKPNIYSALRNTLREHALATVTLPATGKKLVAFDGLPWLGALEITQQPDGSRKGTWKNVEVIKMTAK